MRPLSRGAGIEWCRFGRPRRSFSGRVFQPRRGRHRFGSVNVIVYRYCRHCGYISFTLDDAWILLDLRQWCLSVWCVKSGWTLSSLFLSWLRCIDCSVVQRYTSHRSRRCVCVSPTQWICAVVVVHGAPRMLR